MTSQVFLQSLPIAVLAGLFAGASPHEIPIRLVVRETPPPTTTMVGLSPVREIVSKDGRTVILLGEAGTCTGRGAQLGEMLRDGRLVRRLATDWGADTSVAIAEDGRVAVVGYSDEDLRRWRVVTFDAEGRPLARVDLPAGKQARDPVFVAGGLLVRLHGLGQEGHEGEIIRVASAGYGANRAPSSWSGSPNRRPRWFAVGIGFHFSTPGPEPCCGVGRTSCGH